MSNDFSKHFSNTSSAIARYVVHFPPVTVTKPLRLTNTTPGGHGLTKRMKAGRVSAEIDTIIGGSRDKPSRGVVLAIAVEDR